MDNIWVDYLALMQLIRKYQEGDKFCVIDVYSKYAWIIFLKDEKSETTIKGPYIKHVGGGTGEFLWGS